MSRHEPELRRRLARGPEHLPATERWYLRMALQDRLEWRNLTLLETRFFMRLAHGYFRWRDK